MDFKTMCSNFTENINLLIQTKRDDNNSFLNAEEYTQRIRAVKEARIMLSTPGSKKTVKHYRMVRKYDIINVDGNECLIKPVDKTDQSKVLYYAKTEELFEIIHNAHLAVKHGGRNRMISEINKLYCNITKETVMVYLRLCTQCQEKNCQTRKGLGLRQINSPANYNTCARVDLIDMQSQQYNDCRFILVHQDLLIKFVLLKALKTKSTEEVAHHLLEIYTTFRAPSFLYSNIGQEFVCSVIDELRAMWPGVKIVYEDSRHRQNKGSGEQDNNDVEEMLAAWMAENKTKNWPLGIKFIQLKKNHSLHRGIGKSPYEAMFGCPVNVGFTSSSISYNNIDTFSKEEGVASLQKQIKEETKTHDDNSFDGIQNDEDKNEFYEGNEVLGTIKLELEEDDTEENLIEPTGYEDVLVCIQCSSILPVGEEVNNMGICLACEGQNNIVNKRKRSGELLEKQKYSKSPKLSSGTCFDFQIYTASTVPLPTIKPELISKYRQMPSHIADLQKTHGSHQFCRRWSL